MEVLLGISSSHLTETDGGENAEVRIDAVLLFQMSRPLPLDCSGWLDFGSGFSPTPPVSPNTACYVDVSVTVPHTASTLNLEFSHGLDSGLTNEWFGFNHLIVDLCQQPVCGNLLLETGEQCDDGNTSDGDGCNSSCEIEPGFECSGEPSVCTQLCGNGTPDPNEECDDGNNDDGDGCSSDCLFESGGVPILPRSGLILFAVLLLGTSLLTLRRRVGSRA